MDPLEDIVLCSSQLFPLHCVHKLVSFYTFSDNRAYNAPAVLALATMEPERSSPAIAGLALNASLNGFLRGVVQHLLDKAPHANFFRSAVSCVVVDDYRDHVPSDREMYLNKILERTEAHFYSDVVAFRADLQLLYENAAAYNGRNGAPHQCDPATPTAASPQLQMLLPAPPSPQAAAADEPLQPSQQPQDEPQAEEGTQTQQRREEGQQQQHQQAVQHQQQLQPVPSGAAAVCDGGQSSPCPGGVNGGSAGQQSSSPSSGSGDGSHSGLEALLAACELAAEQDSAAPRGGRGGGGADSVAAAAVPERHSYPGCSGQTKQQLQQQHSSLEALEGGESAQDAAGTALGLGPVPAAKEQREREYAAGSSEGGGMALCCVGSGGGGGSAEGVATTPPAGVNGGGGPAGGLGGTGGPGGNGAGGSYLASNAFKNRRHKSKRVVVSQRCAGYLSFLPLPAEGNLPPHLDGGLYPYQRIRIQRLCWVYIKPNKVVYLPTTFVEEEFDVAALPLDCELRVEADGVLTDETFRVSIKAVPRQGLSTMYCMTNVMRFQQQYLNWQIYNWTRVDNSHIKIHLQSPRDLVLQRPELDRSASMPEVGRTFGHSLRGGSEDGALVQHHAARGAGGGGGPGGAAAASSSSLKRKSDTGRYNVTRVERRLVPEPGGREVPLPLELRLPATGYLQYPSPIPESPPPRGSNSSIVTKQDQQTCSEDSSGPVLGADATASAAAAAAGMPLQLSWHATASAAAAVGGGGRTTRLPATGGGGGGTAATSMRSSTSALQPLELTQQQLQEVAEQLQLQAQAVGTELAPLSALQLAMAALQQQQQQSLLAAALPRSGGAIDVGAAAASGGGVVTVAPLDLATPIDQERLLQQLGLGPGSGAISHSQIRSSGHRGSGGATVSGVGSFLHLATSGHRSSGDGMMTDGDYPQRGQSNSGSLEPYALLQQQPSHCHHDEQQQQQQQQLRRSSHGDRGRYGAVAAGAGQMIRNALSAAQQMQQYAEEENNKRPLADAAGDATAAAAAALAAAAGGRTSDHQLHQLHPSQHPPPQQQSQQPHHDGLTVEEVDEHHIVCHPRRSASGSGMHVVGGAAGKLFPAAMGTLVNGGRILLEVGSAGGGAAAAAVGSRISGSGRRLPGGPGGVISHMDLAQAGGIGLAAAFPGALELPEYNPADIIFLSPSKRFKIAFGADSSAATAAAAAAAAAAAVGGGGNGELSVLEQVLSLRAAAGLPVAAEAAALAAALRQGGGGGGAAAAAALSGRPFLPVGPEIMGQLLALELNVFMCATGHWRYIVFDACGGTRGLGLLPDGFMDRRMACGLRALLAPPAVCALFSGRPLKGCTFV
ncbi:hypothetical protein VOLCADRAFT_91250 [Volvox carteri f. nagariensis]|uniref:Bromo domain-containing protein n=1 Tax=Volvox carteri f. nagariensis TaxID=3068 RepID=D8TWK1_VOLCA|nr:uncharacterized protein VOLCADRAFT_91250 [Volvox carteri f. nagariensis]EFJ48061.1 hypothetical protein VOLCADRAFT_91250 [Volvox carteri f. nagariensis]|eukprot:XP_002950746.1 hypothetical protein VOLCADRAFT_91250 [Volvox carteri f. nagariensis]